MLYNDIAIGGELYHYGVKGMKWGIRRYQPYTSGYQGSSGKYVGENSLNRQGSSENYKSKNFKNKFEKTLFKKLNFKHLEDKEVFEFAKKDNERNFRNKNQKEISKAYKNFNYSIRDYNNFVANSNIKSRKDPNIILQKEKESPIVKMLSKILPNYSKNKTSISNSYKIKDKNGKNVGVIYTEDSKDKDHIYINWISVNKKQRGNGYAQSAMKEIINNAKKNGYKKVTLEVPDEDYAAMHIYEKLGFKDSGRLVIKDGDYVDDSLIKMELKFK